MLLEATRSMLEVASAGITDFKFSFSSPEEFARLLCSTDAENTVSLPLTKGSVAPVVGVFVAANLTSDSILCPINRESADPDRWDSC